MPGAMRPKRPRQRYSLMLFSALDPGRKPGLSLILSKVKLNTERKRDGEDRGFFKMNVLNKVTVLSLWGVPTHRESGGYNETLSLGKPFGEDLVLPTITEDSATFEAHRFTTDESTLS